MPVTAPLIEMTSVTAGYDGRPVIHDVTLSMMTGEVVALLGANGSGKSTLVRAMLGMVPLLSGELRLLGSPLPRFGQRWRIGYVPQRYSAASNVPATVREVVATGRLALRPPFTRERPRDRDAVLRALATVGLQDHAGTDVSRLSGGQQRRVLIARALASEPDLLVMDEPTAGVDLANQEALAETLAPLVREGRSLLLVAHELGPLEPLISRVLVMQDGRIVHDGPPGPDGHATGGHHHDEPASRAQGASGVLPRFDLRSNP